MQKAGNVSLKNVAFSGLFCSRCHVLVFSKKAKFAPNKWRNRFENSRWEKDLIMMETRASIPLQRLFVF
jgi:hypothetical protein